MQDPSNDDPAFLRNRVRHELLPLCADVAGHDPVPLLARQAGVLRDEVTLLNQLAREAAPDPESARALAALPAALARRAVRQWLRAPRGPVRAAPPTRPRWPRSNASWRSPRGDRWPRSSPPVAGCPGGADGCRWNHAPRIVSPR